MVMATDLFDKEMSALRQARWERSFHSPALGFPDDLDDFDRKATLVLENIIQASDVAHTMQHWHIYVKWNERLFFEMYHAFKEGRSAMNPIHSWYTGGYINELAWSKPPWMTVTHAKSLSLLQGNYGSLITTLFHWRTS